MARWLGEDDTTCSSKMKLSSMTGNVTRKVTAQFHVKMRGIDEHSRRNTHARYHSNKQSDRHYQPPSDNDEMRAKLNRITRNQDVLEDLIYSLKLDAQMGELLNLISTHNNYTVNNW